MTDTEIFAKAHAELVRRHVGNVELARFFGSRRIERTSRAALVHYNAARGQPKTVTVPWSTTTAASGQPG